MKRLLVLLAVVFVGSFFAIGVARAQNVQTGDSIVISEGEEYDATLFAAGSSVDIAGTVNGDVYCATQNLTVSGTVNGDIICAARTVMINGVVEGNVRLAAQDLTIANEINGNMSVVVQNMLMNTTAQVTGDISGAASKVTLNGQTQRDVFLASERVSINGSIGRNIEGAIANLEVADAASIGGSVNYTSENEASISEEAAITGDVTRTEPEQTRFAGMGEAGFGAFLYMFISGLLLAMVLVVIAPLWLQKATDRVLKRPGRVILTGFIAIFALPLSILMMFATIVGIPIALFGLLTWILLIFLSGPVVGYTLGRLILRNAKYAPTIMAVGASLLLVLYFIPVFGLLVMFSAYVIGLGILLQDVWVRLPRPKYRVTK